MKQVIAIVKPFLAERLASRLAELDLSLIVITEVKGFGRQKADLTAYEENEFATAYLPKVEFTIWIDDHRAEEILRELVETARTGRMGDGKVFVLPAEAVESGEH
jgi:nitrogen regulatory protein PII